MTTTREPRAVRIARIAAAITDALPDAGVSYLEVLAALAMVQVSLAQAMIANAPADEAPAEEPTP